jgi:dienelactone hydrolase
VPSPFPANNVVHGQWFPAEKPNGKAVIVLPHWNARQNQHGGLCQGLAKFGLSAVRLSLPYHDFRMPAELRRADFAMSSNVARTIDATRQAVTDIRAMIDWLRQMGYERVGICGTSIGSCYACLASAHDPRIDVNVFNHCSTYVADVVWTGLSTIHVKKGLEEHLDLERLRELWNAISPVNFLDKLAEHTHKKSLFIYTKYDTTFIPRLSEDIIREVQRRGIANKVVALPCGHYTMGETPFKFMDGYHIINFLKRNL